MFSLCLQTLKIHILFLITWSISIVWVKKSWSLKSAMTIYVLHRRPKGGRLSGTFTITPTQTKYRGRNGDKNNIQELMIHERSLTEIQHIQGFGLFPLSMSMLTKSMLPLLSRTGRQEPVFHQGKWATPWVCLCLCFCLYLSFLVHADHVVVAIHNQLVAAGNGQLPGESFPLEFISLVQSCTNTNILLRCLAYFLTF